MHQRPWEGASIDDKRASVRQKSREFELDHTRPSTLIEVVRTDVHTKNFHDTYR